MRIVMQSYVFWGYLFKVCIFIATFLFEFIDGRDICSLKTFCSSALSPCMLLFCFLLFIIFLGLFVFLGGGGFFFVAVLFYFILGMAW